MPVDGEQAVDQLTKALSATTVSSSSSPPPVGHRDFSLVVPVRPQPGRQQSASDRCALATSADCAYSSQSGVRHTL